MAVPPDRRSRPAATRATPLGAPKSRPVSARRSGSKPATAAEADDPVAAAAPDVGSTARRTPAGRRPGRSRGSRPAAAAWRWSGSVTPRSLRLTAGATAGSGLRVRLAGDPTRPEFVHRLARVTDDSTRSAASRPEPGTRLLFRWRKWDGGAALGARVRLSRQRPVGRLVRPAARMAQRSARGATRRATASERHPGAAERRLRLHASTPRRRRPIASTSTSRGTSAGTRRTGEPTGIDMDLDVVETATAAASGSTTATSGTSTASRTATRSTSWSASRRSRSTSSDA